MNNTPELWILARSSGIFAYVALTLGVLAGLTLHTRLLGRSVPPAVVTAIHQVLSTVGLVATVLHIGLLVADTHADIPLLGAFVPGLAGHQVIATSLGVIAVELWVCIHFSFAVRKWIGVQRWRKLHRLTFAVWGLAAVHGIAAGTDSSAAWMQDMYSVTIGAVAMLVAYRSLVHAGRKTPPRPAPPRATPPRAATEPIRQSIHAN
jgi:sulfoxide reductase heme-binding subunit YedZ